jgi:hypothetical protein
MAFSRSFFNFSLLNPPNMTIVFVLLHTPSWHADLGEGVSLAAENVISSH